MIKSKKGNEMFDYVSPIYAQSLIMNAVFEAIGNEWDKSQDLLDEILLQLFPQTATWGLVYWEFSVNIASNLSEDIERRRKKVIAKLQSKYVINPERMAMILQNYTGSDIDIMESIAPYTFQVKLTGREGFPKSLSDLYRTVKNIKPSHTSVKYKLISITESKFYIGACTLSGEEIVVYPWSPKDIESKGKINIAMSQNSGMESVTIYPNKEE